MSYEAIAAGGFMRFMIERIEVELEEQRRTALDLIAARCAEALRAVEGPESGLQSAASGLQSGRWYGAIARADFGTDRHHPTRRD